MEFFFLVVLVLSCFTAIFMIYSYVSLIYKPKKETQTQQADDASDQTTKVVVPVPDLPWPPGRTGWPLIGETIDYVSKMRKGVIQDFETERVKKYSSKVFKTSLIGQTMAMLHGVEGNKFLFNNENKLVQVWFPSTLKQLFPLNKDNDGMKKLRKRIAPFINGEGLHKYVGRMDTVMREHLETCWRDREQVKVSVAVDKYAIKLALWYFFSVNDDNKLNKLSPIMDDLAAVFTAVPINLPGTTYRRAIKASKLLVQELEDIVKQRKIDLLAENTSSAPQQTKDHKDLLSNMLLQVDENDQFLKEFDIALSFQLLMVGGYDSLTTTLTFIVKYLAELPHVYHEVLREQLEIAKSKEPEKLLSWDDIRKMRYSWNVACEVLRLIVRIGTFREAITNFTYAGFTIPKGWKLHWIANVTHMNPEYFPDPEKFDPSRYDGHGPPPYTFVPFGGGSRMCPGNEFAKVAILVFMHNLVTKFKWEMLIPNEQVTKTPIPKCSQGLPVRLYPHKP